MPDKGSYVKENGSVLEIGNPFLALMVDTSKGLQPRELSSPRTGLVYADSPYLYRLGSDWVTPVLVDATLEEDGETTIASFEGRIGQARIIQRFTVPPCPYIEETISIVNDETGFLSTPGMSMGFCRSLGTAMPKELEDCEMVGIPFMRELVGRRGEYERFSFEELPINTGSYYPRWRERATTPELAAEGWIWTSHEGSLVISKHSPGMIEFSVLSVEQLEEGPALRFGGASLWHGDPEEATGVDPGSSLSMSTTRYSWVSGGVREGYYAFRDLMDESGHRTPDGFDPPVHWNELYDNPLWWCGEDSPAKRKELYTLEAMEEEARKAREIGCESLYLDPGWDTNFGSSIWPPYRLLEAREFVALMQNKYGLKVSLHMPLAVWCDHTSYPLSAHRRGEDGGVLEGLCSSSPGYLETKKRRLLELAEAGFVYFMFDGTAFTGECWDPSHGHSLPLRRSEHCRAIHELARNVHETHPEIIIELHDPMLGGVPARYAPMHYLHGLSGGFDEGWGFEYMWDPMEDILVGRAISLYYYNLAYSLPLYLHIDLRKDNAHALEFWWYASTCRHLGIGGKHKDPEVWEAHKRAMKTYMRLKRLYAQGTFLGYGEEAHLHFIPGQKVAVLNLFNLGVKTIEKSVEIDLADIGFQAVASVTEGEWRVEDGRLSIRTSLDGRSAKVLEIMADAG